MDNLDYEYENDANVKFVDNNSYVLDTISEGEELTEEQLKELRLKEKPKAKAKAKPKTKKKKNKKIEVNKYKEVGKTRILISFKGYNKDIPKTIELFVEDPKKDDSSYVIDLDKVDLPEDISIIIT